MDFYGIAATSISMSSAKLAQAVDIALLDKSMELEKQMTAQLLDAVPDVAPPPSDRLLDLLV